MFVKQFQTLQIGFVLNQLGVNRDTTLDLLQFGLASNGACTDPTFRLALDHAIVNELSLRMTPPLHGGELYFDWAVAEIEIARSLLGEVRSAPPETLGEYAFDQNEVYHLGRDMAGGLASLLGSGLLTPEQTDSLLRNPAITSTESYRVRMHMLTTPNEPIRHNSR